VSKERIRKRGKTVTKRRLAYRKGRKILGWIDFGRAFGLYKKEGWTNWLEKTFSQVAREPCRQILIGTPRGNYKSGIYNAMKEALGIGTSFVEIDRFPEAKIVHRPKIEIIDEVDFHEEFDRQYMLQPYLPNNNEQKNKCGDCKFFNDKCTKSYLEAKYGTINTPVCGDFISKYDSIDDIVKYTDEIDLFDDVDKISDFRKRAMFGIDIAKEKDKTVYGVVCCGV